MPADCIFRKRNRGGNDLRALGKNIHSRIQPIENRREGDRSDERWPEDVRCWLGRWVNSLFPSEFQENQPLFVADKCENIGGNNIFY
jgi:hypothetical protein